MTRPSPDDVVSLPPTAEPEDSPADPAAQRRARLYPTTTSLRLAAMRRGQIRAVRLRLMEIRDREKRPTEHYLELRISCDQPERVYYVDAKVEFAGTPPHTARLSLLKSRYEATTPVEMMERGCCAERGIALEIRPKTTMVVAWLSTAGSADVPAKLAAQINVRSPETSPPERPEELNTIRLPSIKAVMMEALAASLRAARSDALVTLGRVFAAPGPEALEHIGRLIDLGGDIRLVEAAVRAVEVAEQSGSAGGALDFPRLDLNTTAAAAVAVFHPQTPAYLLNQAFIIAFESNLRMPLPEPHGTFWRELAKAAAVLLVRSHPDLLREDMDVFSCSDDPFQTRVAGMMIDWAARKQRPFTSPPAEPLEVVAGRIAGADPGVALQAAVGILAAYGFIGVSAQLD